jgi:predicted amidophosphoribosyltransferase
VSPACGTPDRRFEFDSAPIFALDVRCRWFQQAWACPNPGILLFGTLPGIVADLSHRSARRHDAVHVGLSTILGSLSPPSCVACRGPCAGNGFLCQLCVGELNAETPVWGNPPPGVSQVVASFRHEGTAADLLRAFKFGRTAGLAPLLAGFMAEHVEGARPGTTVLPVPAARLRRRLRGFDAAGLLARQVCLIAALDPPDPGVIRRVGRGRQRGRGREARMAAPPMILPVAEVYGPVLLVDDVITTGATVSACARVLKSCGAGPVTALSFTRRV